MPIFDYRCKDCGEEFELLVGNNSGEEEKKCTKCKSTNIDRMYSSFGVNMNTKQDLPECPTCNTGTCGLN